jgi:hypothetical protein
MLHAEHAQSLDTHKAKLAADIKATDDPKAKAKLLAEAGKYEHTRDLAEPKKKPREAFWVDGHRQQAKNARWQIDTVGHKAEDPKAFREGHEEVIRTHTLAADLLERATWPRDGHGDRGTAPG